MTTRKVIWAADIQQGSSAHEAACFAIELGLQQFGTATVFKVDGEFVDVEGDEPSGNRPCYDDIFILTPVQMAKVMNEWRRRYYDDPEQFENDMVTMKRFAAAEAEGVEPDVGASDAAYIMFLAKELGFQ